MTLVAGVDSSTQSCKVLVVDAGTGEVVREGRAAHPSGTSVDPEAWWVALQTAIDAAGGLDDVDAISVGGQQHGMVALDADGRVIRDALLWNDTRSADAAAAFVTFSRSVGRSAPIFMICRPTSLSFWSSAICALASKSAFWQMAPSKRRWMRRRCAKPCVP